MSTAVEMLTRIPEAGHDPHAMISPEDRRMTFTQRMYWSLRQDHECPELLGMNEEEGVAHITKILRAGRMPDAKTI